MMIKRTLITPMQKPDKNHSTNMIRICGVCQTQLTPKNTGPLQWLQPDCNECTDKQQDTQSNDHNRHRGLIIKDGRVIGLI